jgi:putative Mg2+ transporter-C (MgtC) family protein
MPLIEHLLLAFALTYILGFERNVRGAAAGDRTFSLVGVGAGMVAALAQHTTPAILSGVITGVGFIGGGLTFHQSLTDSASGSGSPKADVVHGITTATSIFAAAAIGAAAGSGLPLLAITGTALALLILEIRHIPLVRCLDGSQWVSRFGEEGADVPTPDTRSGASSDEASDTPVHVDANANADADHHAAPALAGNGAASR